MGKALVGLVKTKSGEKQGLTADSPRLDERRLRKVDELKALSKPRKKETTKMGGHFVIIRVSSCRRAPGGVLSLIQESW